MAPSILFGQRARISFNMRIKKLFRGPVFFVFLASLIYWIYLASTSRMIIDSDAIGYESAGRMLVQKGWLEYFLTGPNREPLYPFLVSLSMRLSSALSFSYQSIQVFIQLSLLFIAQLLMLRILRLLKINDWISGIAVLYLGISPAIVNSALSLFSEIVTYPLILAAILLTYKSWVSFSGGKGQAILFSILSGLTFVLMVLSKGIFEFIIPVFVALFFLSTLLTRSRKFILNAVLYMIIFSAAFYIPVTGYKLANKTFNGNFAITNRGALVFYGTAAKRAEPLTRESLLTALASVPGERFCQSVFGEERCSSWSFKRSDEFGYSKIAELEEAGLAPGEVDKETIRISLKRISQNPAEYALFWFLEGLKIFFWESTQMGFVSYPPGLTKLFSWWPLKNGLRLSMSILTFASIIYLTVFLWRGRKNVFLPQGYTGTLPFFSVLLIFLFGGVSALCYILPRYTLPIAPLHIIIAAFLIQRKVLA